MPLYEWFIGSVGGFDPVPRQYEFARLELTYTVLSKRKLKQLVEESHVEGWDDPRMPTLAGMRRRGYLPESIVAFCARVGVSKRNSLVDVALFEHRIREDLNRHSTRTMAVLDPLKVTIENFRNGEQGESQVPVHPELAELGTRTISLTKTVFVERDDFMEDPPKQWFRLAPGKEVRLRGACLVTVKEVKKDSSGQVEELIVTWDPESKGGSAADGRKVKGTIHFLSDSDAVPAVVRLYDRLFLDENPSGHEEKDFLEFLNPDSLSVKGEALVHRSTAALSPGERVQFERLGYFCADKTSTENEPIFNRTIGLRDSWARQSGK